MRTRARTGEMLAPACRVCWLPMWLCRVLRAGIDNPPFLLQHLDAIAKVGVGWCACVRGWKILLSLLSRSVSPMVLPGPLPEQPAEGLFALCDSCVCLRLYVLRRCCATPVTLPHCTSLVAVWL